MTDSNFTADFFIKNIPPTHENYNINGNVTKRIWQINDIRLELRYMKQEIVKEIWTKNTSHHRDNDLPAIIVYYDYDKNIKQSEQWYLNDSHYERDHNNPNTIHYYRNGKVYQKTWLTKDCRLDKKMIYPLWLHIIKTVK